MKRCFLLSKLIVWKKHRGGPQEESDPKMSQCEAAGRSLGLSQEARYMVKNLPISCHGTSSFLYWYILSKMKPLGDMFYKWLPGSYGCLERQWEAVGDFFWFIHHLFTKLDDLYDWDYMLHMIIGPMLSFRKQAISKSWMYYLNPILQVQTWYCHQRISRRRNSKDHMVWQDPCPFYTMPSIKCSFTWW